MIKEKSFLPHFQEIILFFLKSGPTTGNGNGPYGLKWSNPALELLLSSDYYGSVFREEADESFEALLYGASGNAGEGSSSSTEDEFNSYLSGLLEKGFALNSDNSSENVSTADLSQIKALLVNHIREDISRT
ncbi:MAG: hypothetical protein QM426_11280 [Euryarchaeota archaeon]|nr:hypothetical protein [Euryarchaeota archaeon]